MRFKDLSPESREIEVDQMWLLPSELKYAEALVVLGHGEFIVAEDKKSSKRPNLFFLAE